MYVFTRSSSDGTFAQKSKIDASDAAADDKFSVFVSLSARTALIGAAAAITDYQILDLYTCSSTTSGIIIMGYPAQRER